MKKIRDDKMKDLNTVYHKKKSSKPGKAIVHFSDDIRITEAQAF